MGQILIDFAIMPFGISFATLWQLSPCAILKAAGPKSATGSRRAGRRSVRFPP
jgi:hypothetical protein